MIGNISKRKHISTQIEKLDPEKDHQEIVFLLGSHCFTWDIERALEFALFRTYAVPSISKILLQTGELVNRTRKRYDDTELIMFEITENGYDSERAKRAFRRMNAMHNRFDISNTDFLYVLTTFIFTPIYWIEKYGWRKLTEKEKKALFIFYKEIGKRMNIKDIPEDYITFEKFHHQYEKSNFEFAESNVKLGEQTRKLILGFYLPKPLYFIGEPFLASLMDFELRNAMGIKHPPNYLKVFLNTLMRLRANIVNLLPERKTPKLGTKVKRPTYPEGYNIEELGTFPAKSEKTAPAKCPF